MAGNEVSITIRAENRAAAGTADARDSVRGLSRDVDELASRQRTGEQASTRYAEGLGSVGEQADTGEARLLGAADGVDGLATVMQGPGQVGLAAYIQGWAALASGMANFVVPAMQSLTIANAKAVAGTVASKTALIASGAAAKVAAAGQWLLNAALTANPIGVVVMAIAALVAAFVLAYKKSETFRDIVDGAMKAIGKAMSWLVDKVVKGWQAIWGAAEKVWGWFKKVSGISEETADATEETAEASHEAADAYRDQSSALDELTDRLLGAADGEMGFEAAIDDATKALRENGKTTDVHTEKGRANRQALQEIVKSTIGWRQALAETGASQAKQNAVTERGREALIRAARQMGMSRRAAEAYADEVLRIPGTKTTTVRLRTSNLAQVRHNFDVVLRDRVVNVRVVTTGSTAIRDNDKATGGIVGAAGGGPRSSRTLVGEQGPEIVDLPFGSRVHSNADSMRMLGDGGGGGRPVLVMLQIGDRTLGEILIDPIRKVVRTVGRGDVQATFGAG